MRMLRGNAGRDTDRLEAFTDAIIAIAITLLVLDIKVPSREANDSNQALWHSLGDIWRRHRVSCPTREELGTWLLDSLGPEEEDYVRFHLEVVGCRLCKANLNDLKQKERESKREVTVRRQRVYQSSAGYLPGERRS